jgi:EXS family/SPX domain
MVKFGRLLRLECVPEWSAAYIDYALLKRLLNAVPDAPVLGEEQDVSDGDEDAAAAGDSLWPGSGQAAGSAGNSGHGSSVEEATNHSGRGGGSVRRRLASSAQQPGGAWRSLDDFFAARGSRLAGAPPESSASLVSGRRRRLIAVAWSEARTPVSTLLVPSLAREDALQPLSSFWSQLDSELFTCNTFYRHQAGFFEKRFEELLAAVKRHRRHVEAAKLSAALRKGSPATAAAGKGATLATTLPTVVEGQPHPTAPVQRRISCGRTIEEVSLWASAELEKAEHIDVGGPGQRPPSATQLRRSLFQPEQGGEHAHPLSEEGSVTESAGQQDIGSHVVRVVAPSDTGSAYSGAETDGSLLNLRAPPSAAVLRLESKQLKHAMRELYRGMAMLLSFSRLNAQAIAKILKKHDKRTGFDCTALYKPFCDACAVLANDHMLVAMQRAIEREFLTLDTQGDAGSETLAARERRERRAQVLHKLRPQQHGPPKSPILIFAGLLIGGSTAASIFLGMQLHGSPLSTILAPVLRGPLLVLLNLSGHGVAVSGWSYNRISWDFIFGQTPGCGLRWDGYLCFAGALALTWLVAWCCVISHLEALWPHISEAESRVVVAPAALLVCSLILLLAPLPRGHLRRLISWPSLDNRLLFWRAALRTAAAPLVHVSFSDFFLADQLISQQQALCDLAYLFCFYTSGAYAHLGGHPGAALWPIHLATGRLALPLQLACVLLPFWIRIAQCLRRLHDERRALHVTNIGKYALGASAAISRSLYLFSGGEGGSRIAFVVCSALASTAGFLWDLRMDWSLLSSGRAGGADHRPLLRPNLMSGPPALYYTAIAVNLVLRFAWFILLAPQALRSGAISLVTLVAALEVCRRCIWSFFRIEAEHVANTASMTAFAPIALPSAYAQLRRLKTTTPAKKDARAAKKRSSPRVSSTTIEAGERGMAIEIEVGESVSNQLWSHTGDMLATIGTPLKEGTHSLQVEEQPGIASSTRAVGPFNTQRFTSAEHFAWHSDGEDDSPGGDL